MKTPIENQPRDRVVSTRLTAKDMEALEQRKVERGIAGNGDYLRALVREDAKPRD